MAVSKSVGSQRPKSNPLLDQAQQLANIQEQYSKAAEARNLVDESNPYGRLFYTPLGDGRYSRNIELAPAIQQQVNTQQAIDQRRLQLAQMLAGQAQTAMADPMDYSGLPDIGGSPDGFGADRQRVEQALMQRARSYLDPMYETQERQMEQKLANEGIVRGNARFNRMTQQLGSNKANAYQNAINDAIAGGGQEQSRLFDMASRARQQILGERIDQRTRPLTELQNALAGVNIQQPQFSGAGVGAQAADVMSPYLNLSQQENARKIAGIQAGAQAAAIGAQLAANKEMAGIDLANKKDLLMFTQELSNKNKPGMFSEIATGLAPGIGGGIGAGVTGKLLK